MKQHTQSHDAVNLQAGLGLACVLLNRKNASSCTSRQKNAMSNRMGPCFCELGVLQEMFVLLSVRGFFGKFVFQNKWYL